VSQAIVSKVEELNAAVVVMPEQRQSLFESFFFQTPVAQQVAQRCKQPTVLIR
jgi:nucleotide-binding universal stress UspA family protein